MSYYHEFEKHQHEEMVAFISSKLPVIEIRDQDTFYRLVITVIQYARVPAGRVNGGWNVFKQAVGILVLSNAWITLKLRYKDLPDGLVKVATWEEMWPLTRFIKKYQFKVNLNVGLPGVDVSEITNMTLAMRSLRSQTEIEFLAATVQVNVEMESDADAKAGKWLERDAAVFDPVAYPTGLKVEEVISCMLQAIIQSFPDDETVKIFRLFVCRDKATYEENWFKAHGEYPGGVDSPYTPSTWKPWLRSSSSRFMEDTDMSKVVRFTWNHAVETSPTPNAALNAAPNAASIYAAPSAISSTAIKLESSI